MADDEEEATDGLQPVRWARMTDLPAESPLGRLDFGDAAQRAEMDSLDEFGRDEPMEMVDAPIQIRPPFTRAEKRCNQRPLPT